MQELKLAFYIGKKSKNPKATFLDSVICLFTRSKYSHVELIYDLDHENMRALAWSSSPLDGGVRRTTIDIHQERWDVFAIDGVHTSDELHAWFEKHEGKKYDWAGAIGVKFRFLKHHSDKWFCSEIIASYLGLKRPHRISPIKLYRHLSPRLKRLRHPKKT